MKQLFNKVAHRLMTYAITCVAGKMCRDIGTGVLWRLFDTFTSDGAKSLAAGPI